MTEKQVKTEFNFLSKIAKAGNENRVFKDRIFLSCGKILATEGHLIALADNFTSEKDFAVWERSGNIMQLLGGKEAEDIRKSGSDREGKFILIKYLDKWESEEADFKITFDFAGYKMPHSLMSSKKNNARAEDKIELDLLEKKAVFKFGEDVGGTLQIDYGELITIDGWSREDRREISFPMWDLLEFMRHAKTEKAVVEVTGNKCRAKIGIYDIYFMLYED